MRRLLAPTLVTLAALTAVAGCSSSDPSSAPKAGSKPDSSSTSTAKHSTDAGGSGSTAAATPGCDLVTPAEIESTLGVSVGAPEVTENGPVTVCTYPSGDTGLRVIVRFETGFTDDDVAASRAKFESTQQPTADVTGIGDVAFSSTLGAGSVQASTIEALQGSTDVLITAGAPLTAVETLAKQVLAKL